MVFCQARPEGRRADARERTTRRGFCFEMSTLSLDTFVQSRRLTSSPPEWRENIWQHIWAAKASGWCPWLRHCSSFCCRDQVSPSHRTCQRFASDVRVSKAATLNMFFKITSLLFSNVSRRRASPMINWGWSRGKRAGRDLRERRDVTWRSVSIGRICVWGPRWRTFLITRRATSIISWLSPPHHQKWNAWEVDTSSG